MKSLIPKPSLTMAYQKTLICYVHQFPNETEEGEYSTYSVKTKFSPIYAE